MDVLIYRDIPMMPDKLIGRIDEKGKVYDVESGKETYVGWINYEEGDVYDEEDDLMGWIEDDGAIVGHYDEDEDLEIGYITEQGEVYGYGEEEGEEIYVGKLKNMQNGAEGAAAMLLFFDLEEE